MKGGLLSCIKSVQKVAKNWKGGHKLLRLKVDSGVVFQEVIKLKIVTRQALSCV